MPKTIVLEQALILPVNDITAMLQGQLIVAIPKVQIAKGLSFLLAPEQSNSEAETLERYRLPFLPIAEMVPNTRKEGSILVEAWATCEQVKMICDVGHIPTLSSLTVWNQLYLEELLKEQQHLFLTYLKVYRLPSATTIPSEKLSTGKTGKFVGLLSMKCSSVQVVESCPILSDHLFEQRKQKLEDLTPPEHPELEILQSAIDHYAQTDSKANRLDEDLRTFLGWTNSRKIEEITPTWIKEITVSGNSSDGDFFEKRVRQGFVHLGFTNNRSNPKVSLNPEASGGSGGLDFYCEFPYPIVGECKASKDLKVNDNKDGAPAQLIKLGHKHLTPEEFSYAIKIIMAPGELTKDSEKTAIGNHMNVIKPETLERLVNLKNSHPGSIDLLKLKPYLEQTPFGIEADERLDEYTSSRWQLVKLRSHVVKTFKEYLEKTKSSASGVEKFSGFFCNSNAPQHLEDRELHEILIELSSPLTGYLGRTKGNTWKDDRFYFLRDLIV